MSALHVARIPRCDPARFARVEAGLLARGSARPLLVLAGLGEPALLLGRHQRARSAVDVERARARGLVVSRRAGGGRELVIGDGALGAFLLVPPADPLSAGVPADRLLGRLVRGLLAGLRASGARGAAWYGRDFVSVDGRQVAIVSQEGTASGAVALEAIVGVARPLAVPSEFTTYPRSRDARAAGPRPVTLEELRGNPVAFDDVAGAITQGYAAAHDREVVSADGVLPEAPLPPVEEDEAGLRESGLVDAPIGFAEALAAVDGGRIVRARVRGDFLAPALAVAALEAAVEGAPLDRADIGRRAEAAFRRPGAFLHGVADARVLADALADAVGAA